MGIKAKPRHSVAGLKGVRLLSTAQTLTKSVVHLALCAKRKWLLGELGELVTLPFCTTGCGTATFANISEGRGSNSNPFGFRT